MMNNWDRVQTNLGRWTGNGRGASTPPEYCQGTLEEGTELPNPRIVPSNEPVNHKGALACIQLF